VDCVIIDEAGQISLGAVSLVVRSLSSNGRIVIAGDSEQLAPILSAQYPQLKSNALFGSVLDCLMFSRTAQSLRNGDQPMPPSPSPADDEATLFRVKPDNNLLRLAFEHLQHDPQIEQAKVTADRIERLQGKFDSLGKSLYSY
jgi:hypothetical protein